MPIIRVVIDSEDKEWLAAVAASQGLSLSSFVRSAAIKQAHTVLGPPRVVVPVITK